MGRLKLTRELVEAAVTGGSFYGGGGGGSAASGREMGLLAVSLGDPVLVDLSELEDDALVLTVSAVGAPAAAGSHAKAYHFVRAVQVFLEHVGVKVSGFITNECGGLATVNGWVQSAIFGIPVVDAPCNGRAHPTGTMGSMGLHRVPGYMSLQAAVGGSEENGTYLEVFVRGSLERAASMVRQASVQAGGLVAVARNPVKVSYARNNAAVGAINRCIQVGLKMLEAQGRSAWAVIEAAAGAARGRVVCAGKVVQKHLETKGGFDVGTVRLETGHELTFWNEYITLETEDGTRLATFPDLIATMNVQSGMPLSSAEIEVGHEVAVVVVPQDQLILGAGARDRSLYVAVEKATGKKIT